MEALRVLFKYLPNTLRDAVMTEINKRPADDPVLIDVLLILAAPRGRLSKIIRAYGGWAVAAISTVLSIAVTLLPS